MTFFASVTAAVSVANATAPPEHSHPPPGYELTWHDEFEGDALDETKWSLWHLGQRRDAVNVEDAVSLDGDGHLVIEIRGGESDDGPRWETGGVWSRGLFKPRYGYIECRMQVQTQPGFWSAFWLNHHRMGHTPGDPAGTGVEIDVMEYIAEGWRHDLLMNTIHFDGYGEHHKKAHHSEKIEGLGDGFHTYAVLWTPDELVFFVDGEETWRTREAVPQIAQHMIVSCEVGSWGGDIALADLPDTVQVDFVRVWQLPDEPRP